MRLTIFLLTVAIVSVHASGVSQTMTLSGRNMSLKKIFSSVKRQTGFSTLYNQDYLEHTKPVTFSVADMPLNAFLDIVLNNQPVAYRIEGKTISIYLKAAVSGPVGADRQLDFLPVTGIVKSEDGQPLAGINVIVKGTKNGAVSNATGKFSVNANEGSILIFSGIGFESQEIKVKGNTITIILSRKVSALDETIVQAYGTTSRRLNTGNISKVTADEIARQPVGNPLAALEGRVPGMIVTQSTGIPGGSIKVEVRGRTAIDRTITDDQPLFVIDGVPVGANNAWLGRLNSSLGTPSTFYSESSQGGISPFNGINPQDIESIEVLKDADATAIYGSRGANGVILITTKRGKTGKSQVNVNVYSGWSKATRTLDMMDTKQYVAMRKQAFANDNVVPTNANAYDFLVWDTTRYTALDKLYPNATAQVLDAQTSLSGGSSTTHYLIGGSYRRETTVIEGDYAAKRGSMHFNLNHHSTDQRFKMQFSGLYTINKSNLLGGDPRSSFSTLPNIPVFTADGQMAWGEKGYNSFNPLTAFLYKNKSDVKTLQSNLQLSYDIVKGLTIRMSAGYNSDNVQENTISPGTTQNPANTVIYRTSYFSDNKFESWILEPQAEYTGKLSKGTLKILGGLTWQNIVNNGKSVTADGYGSDDLMQSITAATQFYASNWSSQYLYFATFGRVNYNWLDKYIINLTARRDGSSRFGKSRQYSNFGAVGAAWIFTNEELLKKNSNILSFGKLRTSYGLTGNDKIKDYQYLDTWMSVPTTYDGVAGLYPDKLYNPDYRWEKTTKSEIGLDLGFLNDRLLFSAVYYNNRSSNQLVQYRLPRITGFANVVANLPASVENSGWELTLGSTVLKTVAFSWTSSANVTIPRNRLLSFPGLKTSSYASRYVENHSLNIIYGYKYLGVDPQTGIYTFEDVDKNGIYDVKDYQVVGKLDPVLYGGWQNGFNFKNFQLDLFFSFRKQTGRSYVASIDNPPGIRSNLPAAMMDVWEKPGDQATFQKFSNNNTDTRNGWSRYRSSNGIYTDASFIRLKNASISYLLNPSWLKKGIINNCRVYIQGQNLLTITKYKVTDPETQYMGRTPPLLTITAGINVTFK